VRYIFYTDLGDTMSKNKTETLNLRLGKSFKQALIKAAEKDHRSITNLIESLIAHHCKSVGIDIEKDSRINIYNKQTSKCKKHQ
jgi:uncharacterized protein (DUF1778 family)